MNKEKSNIWKWLCMPLLALVIFGLTRLFGRYPHLTEKYYSQLLYPEIATFISGISKWIPVSADDVFYMVLIAGGIIILFLIIFRKISLKVSGLLVLNALAAVYALFYLLWGFNYFRTDMNQRLQLESHSASPEEFFAVFSQIVEAANDSYTTFDDFDKSEISVLIEKSYSRLASDLKLSYPSGTRRAKYITFSGFFAQAGISGYFGPFFNEIHINRKLLPVEYPFVLAHEKAHQFGITGEAEANFYAWLICSHSDSKQLRYSASLVAVRYFMNHGYRLEGYREVVSQLDKRIIEDIRYIGKYWSDLRNEKVEAVASRVNDTYLKTNQVEKGIKDYTGIVKHIMDFSLDTTFKGKAGF